MKTALITVLSATVLSLPAATLTEITITSTRDARAQKAFWWHPPGAETAPVPLVVMLHTWSGDYRQKSWKETGLTECERRGWALIHPDFRGPNRRPEACASELAVQDILDAVDWARKQVRIDARRIYLVGTSGGGHMSLTLAGRAPELWAGVSAWVPISDLAAWHRQTTEAGRKNYAANCEKVCGGRPGDSPQVDAEYRQRSPLTHLHRVAGLPLDINAGIHDGHTGSVPVSHSLHAFNAAAVANGRHTAALTTAQIHWFRTRRSVPEELRAETEDEADRIRPILFRRTAGPARVTIFDGGHEGDMASAFRWMEQQVKSTK
jgi:dipeptidyl aminopeptidase/acylaminoacyl peptidase